MTTQAFGRPREWGSRTGGWLGRGRTAIWEKL
ncbi:hypothetical protein BPC006_I1735 [Burkholderia pseudomallei BPC006]|nr:hypothetical protein BPC006_I1735 [Burkholderia pseudomallei BPC006]